MCAAAVVNVVVSGGKAERNRTCGLGCGGERPGTAQSRNDLCFPPSVGARNSRRRDDAAPPYVCRLTRHRLVAYYATLALCGSSSEQSVVSPRFSRLSLVEVVVAFCSGFSLVFVTFPVSLSRIPFVVTFAGHGGSYSE